MPLSAPVPRSLGGKTLPPWVADAAVLLLVAACMFWGLGRPPIRDNNEALYADIAMAMSRGGSWLIPHLDGVPYIEKPPLLYWLMALSFKAFGVGAWQARLPDALAAWAASLGCILLGRRLDAPLAGRAAALMAGTSLGWVEIGRTILFDPLMSLGWLAALALVVLAEQRESRALMRWAMLPLGLAVMTKGPEALALLGLVGLVQLLLSPGPLPRARMLRLFLDPWAIALFLLVALPWQLLAAWHQSGFAWFFWVNETIDRFLGTRIPEDFHHGPWWYYLPKLLIGTFQWTGPMAALALCTRRAGASPAARSAVWARNASLGLLLFFSASSDKGAYYLLPVVVLLAWWAGQRLQQAVDEGRIATARGWIAAGCLLFGLAAAGLWLAIATVPEVRLMALRSGLPPPQCALLPWLSLSLLAISLLAALLLRSGLLEAGLLVFGLSGMAMSLFATELAVAKTPDTSQQHVAQVLHAMFPRGVDMYSWQTFEDQDASLLFYGLRPLRVIDSKSSDLWFGCRHAAGPSPCVGTTAVRDAMRAGRPLAVWVARDRLASFLGTGLAVGMRPLGFRDSIVFVRRGSAP
ncbi:MAG: glycosyltransferase family 39 protein [Betaproteobacteria bacterium]|nr:glycosyltransferase family 39 protein [Betaproteobacteria bacterium]